MADETQLIEALQRRDQAALSTVFEQYANKIYRLAAGILQDEQQADGVVQDTFLKLIEHIDSFEGRSSIGTWLYRVAYNEANGRLRKSKPQVNMDELVDADLMPACLVDWETLPEQVMSSSEALDLMQQAIEDLSPSLRAVFQLRDIDELSTQETADILGIKPAAVKVRLHRARLALRERLAHYFEEYTSV